jgi:hypothetical protein
MVFGEEWYKCKMRLYYNNIMIRLNYSELPRQPVSQSGVLRYLLVALVYLSIILFVDPSG